MMRSTFGVLAVLLAVGCSAGTDVEPGAASPEVTAAKADRYTPWCAEDGSIACPGDFWKCGEDFVDAKTLANGAPQDTALKERREDDPKSTTIPSRPPFKPAAECGKPGAPSSCPRFCVLKSDRVPWCELGSDASMAGRIHETLACPHGWQCGTRRVNHNLLGDGAPNDVGNFSPDEDGPIAHDGPDCGEGGADDDTCPRFCVRR
jgi:hypothetical protein